jgi:methionyl-tRNA synthetase
LDQVRYFFLREMVFGLDALFSEEALRGRINHDLANDLGNLLARVMGMSFKYRQGIVPPPGVPDDLDKEVTAEAQAMARDFLKLFPALDFSKALSRVWEFINLLNRYIVAVEPWALAKDEAMAGRLDTVLYHLLEGLRWLAALLRPVMPESALKMSEQLGLGLSLWDHPLSDILTWGRLTPGGALKKGKPLFPRLEAEEK